MRKRTFTFIDLFAGIGGTRLGVEAVGGACLYTSEYDGWAGQTYSANFHIPHVSHPIHGDITKIDAATIPAHDLIVGGFPCQPFSIAGVSKKNSLGRAHGFADATQGTLFFDVLRIAAHHRPAALLLENVRNLVHHDGGRTLKVIMGALAELGYHAHWRVIDACHWVPQHRRRIYIAAFRDANDFDFETLQLPEGGPVLRSILHHEDGTEEPDGRFIGEDGRVAEKYTLSDRLWEYLQNYAAKHRKAGNGFGFGLVGPDDVSRTLSARYGKDGSEILVRQGNRNPRRLTPRECARLMGFREIVPAQEFRIPVSDSRAYKQFGNAAVPAVVEAVARHMLPYLPRREGL